MTELTIVVIQEGDQYVAQALEHDVTGQGDSIGEAVEELGICLRAQAELQGLEQVAPSPLRYWKRCLGHVRTKGESAQYCV
jgi:hypothetical protein